MNRHIQTFGQSGPWLQCVNVCCVFVGDISFEIKSEADSYAMPECLGRLLWGSLIVARGLSLQSLILNSGPVCMVCNSFCPHQIILLCYRLNGLFEGFYIQQHCDPELTPCQRELKFDVLPVTPPHYQTDNSILWDRFTLPNTTRDSDHCWLRIYEWIPYTHRGMSYHDAIRTRNQRR